MRYHNCKGVKEKVFIETIRRREYNKINIF